jgi:hypothetical protein
MHTIIVFSKRILCSVLICMHTYRARINMYMHMCGIFREAEFCGVPSYVLTN